MFLQVAVVGYLDVNAAKKGCQVFLLKLGMETLASDTNSFSSVKS